MTRITFRFASHLHSNCLRPNDHIVHAFGRVKTRHPISPCSERRISRTFCFPSETGTLVNVKCIRMSTKQLREKWRTVCDNYYPAAGEVARDATAAHYPDDSIPPSSLINDKFQYLTQSTLKLRWISR